MSILKTLISKVLGRPSGESSPAAGGTEGHGAAATASGPGVPATNASVDVGSVLEEMNRNAPQKLSWKTSIVDLMKLLGMDSSLATRKELAKELNYSGDANDSAMMNIWLHKQIMKKLTENGGKLPDDLKHST